MSSVDVQELATAEEVRALEPLLREYLEFVSGEVLRIYGVDVPAETELHRTFSNVDEVLPPKGNAFAVYHQGAPAGMVFIRPAAPEVHEIKRLYVQPVLRGTGAGRALAERGIAAARSLGARRMVLDSTKNLTDAARLYRSLGFVYCDTYAASDHGASGALAPHMIFMEKRLD